MASKVGCRLCLAPREECVEIWSNFGADVQQLELKILNCVHIKVSKDDHLSSLICHVCISYLNSWHSFKNRCDAAERKQREVSNEIFKSQQKKYGNQIPDPSKYPIKEEPSDVEITNGLDQSLLMRLPNEGQPEDFPNNQLPHQQDEFGNELFDADGNSSSTLRNPQTCPVCDKQYNNYYNVLRHMESKHPNQLPQIYQCTRCSQGFPRHSELRDHLNNVHEETVVPVTNAKKILYSCRQCSKAFNSINLLEKHMKMHQNNGNEKCNKPADSGIAPSIPGVNEEQTISDQSVIGQTLNCGLCDFALISIEALRQHMSEIHGMDKKFFYCNLCSAKFMNNRGLRLHLIRSHGVLDESFPLTNTVSIKSLLKPPPQVPSMTPQISSINNEEDVTLTQKDGMLNECKLCHNVYKNVEQLSLHVQLVHPSLENNASSYVQQPLLWFQCRYCIESFNARKKLTLHMNTAHEEVVPGDYTCKDCGGVYVSKKSLWVHRYKKHPKVSDPSPCEMCSQVFFDKMELFHHTSLTHVDGVVERTAEAKRCANDQEFRKMHIASDSLFNMLTTSTVNTGADSLKAEETVYQCDMCPKKFVILRNLQSHRGWHYRSPDGRKIRDPNDIWQPDQLPPSKLRRKQSAGGIPIQKSPPTCPHCLSTYATSNNLKRHIIEVHKMKPHLNSNVLKPNACGLVKTQARSNAHVNVVSTMNINASEHREQHYMEEKQEKFFEFDAVAEEDSPEEAEDNDCSKNVGEKYFCELCQLYFISANALRRHVSEHFLNDGIEGHEPLQKGSDHRISTDSKCSTNSSENNTENIKDELVKSMQ